MARGSPETQRGFHLSCSQAGPPDAVRVQLSPRMYHKTSVGTAAHALLWMHVHRLRTQTWDATLRTKPTATTAMSYSPRILRGRRHSEGLFQTVPLSHLSFQEICHKSDECPLIRVMGHCKNGWHDQCARRGVCCTVRNQQKYSHYKPFDQPGAHPS